jgi:hypothetical protein
MRNRRITGLTVLTGLAMLVAAPALGQNPSKATEQKGSDSGNEATTSVSTQPAITMQHFRPQDQRGISIFEPPKTDDVAYAGFRMDWGAAFTQQLQALEHSNTATPNVVNGIDANQLIDIGTGFNNASANLFLNAQLAPGIRVALTTYLSSRHHNEAWVKDGYLLIDDLPVDMGLVNRVMEYVTIKAGHFEINYGDAHFRRSDNGNALYNPFVGNLILDAFTTEIGAEVYLRSHGFLAMASLTGGEIKGNLLSPDDRSPALIFKLGYDRQLTPDLRVRLTGSHYSIDRSPANTLFAGDRAGSRYFFVLENTQATSTANASSGLINPGFRYKVDAVQVNPFIQFKGLELFGVIERAEGRMASETAERAWTQYALDGAYRFGARDAFYVAGRYNTAQGELAAIPNEVSVDRYQLGAGWFLTPSILLKGEYVRQKYFDFPVADIRSGGKFNGVVIEGVVAF